MSNGQWYFIQWYTAGFGLHVLLLNLQAYGKCSMCLIIRAIMKWTVEIPFLI